MSFADYLVKLSLGGAIAVGVIVVILPWLFPEIWHKELDDLEHLPHPKINHPRVLAVGGLIRAFVLTFFVVGESLPVPISPAAVALLGAALAMLLAHHTKIDSVNNILRDLDWSTLLFFMSIFVLIGGLEKTGVIGNISGIQHIPCICSTHNLEIARVRCVAICQSASFIQYLVATHPED